jgi:gluconate 2-dehydrogenase gamma chain
MAQPASPSRRDFLARSGSAAGGAWLAGLAPLVAAAQACAADARRDGLPFSTFTEREGADFDAFAGRIIPADETPGAREAGAVYFADQALGSFMADLLPEIRSGLARLHERAMDMAARPFAELSATSQDELVAVVEQQDPAFFSFARSLVVLGVLTDPAHGGNRDGIGWQMIGFEDDFAYQPPFGYYDRDEHGAGA